MTQEEYDLLLIESFYLRPDYPMWRICGYSNCYVLGLKRKPTTDCLGITVCAFVCNYLPGIANVLWKRNKNDIPRIAKAVSKSPINTRKKNVNNFANKREMKERKAEIKKYQKIMELTGVISRANDRCGGNEWHTVK